MPDYTTISQLIAAHKSGRPVGIYSVCSAHPYVLAAAARLARQTGQLLLVESTCNQVNQYGGYTRMTPQDFMAFILEITDRHGLPRPQVILGGDHLGPSPWQAEPAASAMAKSRRLVQDYVWAGYTKIHLDASMRCADDVKGAPLDPPLATRRAAELCRTAEQAHRGLPAGSQPPCYVIGTEVPVPGGAQVDEGELSITEPSAAQETIELTHAAFLKLGLEAAWERVIALVVQPGVEFSDAGVYAYDRRKATPLSKFIERTERLAYEAHSTDYQPPVALKQMVEDHFAILKVGPALTFAFREAVFALESIEREWLESRPGVQLSRLRETLEQVMLEQPWAWEKYYHGDERARRFARKYSYSDRSRYYWSDPRLEQAVERLFANLDANPVPQTLLIQFLPEQYARLRAGLLAPEPQLWVEDRIISALRPYADACA